MKLLVLTQMFPCRRHPTSAVFFANLLRELVRLEQEIVVVTPRAYIPGPVRRLKPSLRRWYLDDDVSVEHGMKIVRPHIPMLRGARYIGVNGLIMQASLDRLFGRLIAEQGTEMLLGYNMIPEGIAVTGLAVRFGLPSAFWAIGSDVNDYDSYNRVNRLLSRRCIGSATAVFAESRALEERVRALSPRPLQVHTFYKGIDLANFAELPPKPAVRGRLGLDPKRRYILFVGRLIREKGIDELAAAFVRIARQYSDIDLVMAGEEIEKDALVRHMQAEGLLNRVRFTGLVPYADIALYMKAADLLVLPTWAEGLPNVVMEAMGCGLPVVATAVGGIPEILADGETGLLVPPRDAAALEAAMLRMLSDAALNNRCRQLAAAVVHDSFDVAKNAGRLVGILDETRERFLSARPACRGAVRGAAA